MIDFNVKENMVHKPPMLMVDKILEEDGMKTKTSFAIKEDNICLDENGILARAALIEIAAQSFAAIDRYRKLKAGLETAKGFLASIKDYNFYGNAKVGDEIICVLEKTDEIAGMHIVNTDILVNDNIIASGEIRIFEFPEDGM